MLDEELARAILIGDGRDVSSPDKIDEDRIRPVWKDADMYTHKVALENTAKVEELIDSIVRARREYKGSGDPTFYTTPDVLTDMLLLKDKMGRNLYESVEALAAALRVAAIVEVEPMIGQQRDLASGGKAELRGIIVNLKDYNIGTDKGGGVSMFDDFDIDFNQHKYLMETRCSGALIKPKSAIAIEQKTA